MSKLNKYTILSFFVLISNFLFAQNNCDWSTIDDASENYRTGNFNQIINLLEKCMVDGFNEKQKVQAYRLIAKTYIALDKDSTANASVNELLKIDPQFQPDYLSDSPKFISILNNIKDKISALLVTSVSKKAENINEAPATVILITEKQLKNRGYLDLEAMLHDLPGFDISRSNGNLYSHIYQRGYRSINTNRTLFLVDGVEENDLWSSNVYLSRQYAMSNIKNVEVIYGPASTMYGSNAFLGVINVITKEPQDFIKPGKQIGVNAKMGYGSYNTMFFDGTIAARTKNNNIALSFTSRVYFSDEQDLSSYSEHSYEPRALTTDLSDQYLASLNITAPTEVADFLTNNPNSSSLYSLNGSNELILTDAGLQQALDYDNDVYDKVSFSDKTEAYYFEGKLKIYDFLIGGAFWHKAEGPGAQYNDEMFMGFDQGQSWRPVHNYFYVKYDKDVSAKLNISNFLRYKVHDFDKDNSIVRYRKNYLSGHFDLQDMLDGNIPVWDSLYLFQKSNQLREEFKVLYTPINKIDIVAGFEARFSSIQGDYTFSRNNDAEENGSPLTDIPGGNQFFSRDLGVYVQTGISLTESLKLTLGIRYDNNKIRETQGYGDAFNPRIALVYKSKGFIVKAIYAEAFKDATNREKYSTAPGKRELNNPDLQPEKVKNYELAIGKNLSEDIFVNASVYYSQYSNIIQEVEVQLEDGSFTNQNQAKGKGETMGVNAMANWNLDDLTVYANYTYTLPYTLNPTDSEGNPLTDSLGNPYTKLRISDIADHQVNIGANYLYRNVLNFNLRMNFSGKRQTGENTTVPTNTESFNPYAIFNGSVSYTPKNLGITAQFSVFNILDTEYFSPGLDAATGVLSSKMKQNGRNIHLSLIYQF